MAALDDLASKLFGSKRAESNIVSTDATTRTYVGTATSASEDGSVYVALSQDVTLPDDDDGEHGIGVEMPTTVGVSEGDEVLVTLMGGGTMKSPVVTGNPGWGDSLQAQVDNAEELAQQAEDVAQEAAEEVEQVRQDVADFRSDVATTYATKVEREDGDDAVKTWVTTNYTNSNDLATTYATKTLVSQTKDAIELAASQTYETQSDAAATYATKAALTVGLDGIRSEVAEDYQPKGDYATTASMNSAIQQSASSIESTVAATYTTKAEFEGLQVGGTNLLWDSAFDDIANTWLKWGTPTTYEVVNVNGVNFLHVKTSGARFQGIQQNDSKRAGVGEISAGEKFVFSVDAYGATSTQLNVGIHWLNSSHGVVSQNWFAFNIGTTPERYVHVDDLTAPTNAVAFNIMIGNNTTDVREVWFAHPMFERGTIATDWSPAPEDVATTYATKTEVQQTASGLDTRITTAQSTADGAYLERTASGTTIDTTGAATIRSLVVEGQSVQDGTPSPSAPVPIVSVESRNLATTEVYRKGYLINADGTETASANQQISAAVPVTGGETYHVSYSCAATFNDACRIGWYTNQMVFISRKNVSKAGGNITAPSNAAYLRYCRGWNAANPSNYIYDLQIERGTTAHPYQPYGCVTLVAQSRNLLDSGADATSTNAANHITTTRTNGVYRLTGTSATTGGRLDAIYKNLTTLQAGTYTLSQETSGTGNYTAFLHDENNVILAQLPYDRPSVNVTLDATTRVFVGINVTQIGTYDRTIAFQIEHGSTATAYTPYVNSRTDIDLQGHALRSLPDGTRDEMAVDSLGRVTMTQRVGSKTFSGTTSEIWSFDATKGGRIVVNTPDAAPVSGGSTVHAVFSNRFAADTYNNVVAGTTGKVAQWINLTSNQRFAITTEDSTITSVNLAAAWLASNQTTIIYPLATPQTIDLGTIDLPTPADTLWLDAALVPTIEATWWTVGGIAGQQALDAEVTERQTLIRQFSGGVLAGYVGNAIAALVNAAGSFDVVRTAWTDGVPSILGTLARYAASGISLFDAAGNVLAEFASDHVRIGGDVPDGTGVESAVQFFDQTETHDTDMTASIYFDGDGSTYQTMQSTVNLSSTLADEDKAIDTGSSGTAALDLVNMLENGISDVGEQHNEVHAALVADASYSDGATTSHAAVRATASTTGGSGLSYAELIADALGIGENEGAIDYTTMRQVLVGLRHPSATYTAGVGTWTNGHPNAWEIAGYTVEVAETGNITDYIDTANKGVGEFTALVGCTVRVAACVTWVDSVAGRRSVGAFVNATRSGTTLTGGTEYSNSGLFYTGSNAKTAQLSPLILHLAAGNRLNFGKYAPASAVQSNQTYKMNWVTIEVLSVD